MNGLESERNLLAKKSNNLDGIIAIPGDKSISHRAIMISMLAEGKTKIYNFLEAEDTLITINVARQLGIEINQSSNFFEVQGKGLNGIKQPDKDLYFGNSGTSMRLFMGILSTQNFPSILTGDDSLSQRPMERVAMPLRKMGAIINMENNQAPIFIHPAKEILGIKHVLDIASAQVKSAILLAALYANPKTVIVSESVTRNHTELMLQYFKYPIQYNHQKIELNTGKLSSIDKLEIPCDFSSAAFLILATILAKNSRIVLENIGLNPTRIGFLKILEMMGADIKATIDQNQFEPSGTIEIKSSQLHGINVPKYLIPLSIDELPLVFLAAACAKGKTTVRNADELRLKESDRIKSMKTTLTEFSINVIEHNDGLTIEGGTITGGEIDSFGDHRVAMTTLIASVCSEDDVLVKNTKNIDTSFPDFVAVMNKIGLNIQTLEN
ncbi:MAG: 3-phosphoshikimate 1-carboxyvinyltransferase [Pseudomonadota bacterium]|nr:3-phosphoshikimate 1-carboxyvinyltransferase [Pseudomonadota bacterium]